MNARVPAAALIVAFFAIPLATGCNQSLNLAAVQTFTTQAAASKETFDAVSEDFYDSCLRASQYTTAAFDVSACDQHQQAAKLWQVANAELLSYVASLGALATDKQTDFGLSNLTAAVGALPSGKISAAQQAAIAGAGKGLLSGIFAAQRRDALAAVMSNAERPDAADGCPNGCLKALVDQLTQIAQADYFAVLKNEDNQIDVFYVTKISLAEAPLKPSASQQLNVLVSVGQLLALGQHANQDAAHQNVTAKRAAIKQYVAALNQIVIAHHSVVKAIQENSPEQIVGIASEFVATYSAQLSAIRKAFK